MDEKVSAKRLIILGRNSKVWASLRKSPLLADIPIIAIGHVDLLDFEFHTDDIVWVFSYSRSFNDNRRMLERIPRNSGINVVYVSSASTNVTAVTKCYKYPSLKMQAQQDALEICTASIVNIGWFYVDASELPPGRTAATSVDTLALALRDCNLTPGNVINLFDLLDRPFNTEFEKSFYDLYGLMVRACGSFPCIMRPLDVLLRFIGMRWYGYLYLSNKLWCTTISS